MRKETIYIADDGAKFNTEYECDVYEFKKRLNDKKDTFMLFDSKFNETNNIGIAYYIYVKNEDGIKILEELFDNEGYFTPWLRNNELRHLGVFYFDDNTQEWLDLDKELNTLLGARNKISEMIAKKRG